MASDNRSGLKAWLYRRFRYSSAYLPYARAFRRGHARAVAADRAFFGRLFAEQGVRSVFDVGANVGEKADVFRRLAEKVVCVEADPDTAAVLRYRFGGRPGVVVAATAVGERVGEARLRRKRHSGFNTLSDKWAAALDARALPTEESVTVPLTTLDRLVAAHGRPDYIKIDVEGYELPVLLGLTAAVPVLSFECNLPEFRGETEQILARLLALRPDTRFNARVGDAPTWALPAPVEAAGLGAFFDAAPAPTCDVFALVPRA